MWWWGSKCQGQTQNSLLRIFCLQPDLEQKFLLRRTWSGRKRCSHGNFQTLELPLPDFSLHQAQKVKLADFRGRNMNTNSFCTNFLNTPTVPGYPGKMSGTSQVPSFETQGKQTFEGGRELFDHPLLRVEKIPTPPGSLRTQKVNLCALFSCPRLGG